MFILDASTLVSIPQNGLNVTTLRTIATLWLSTSYFIRKYLLCIFVGPWILEYITRLSSSIGYDFVVVVMLQQVSLRCCLSFLFLSPSSTTSLFMLVLYNDNSLLLLFLRVVGKFISNFQHCKALQSGKSVNKLFTMNASSSAWHCCTCKLITLRFKMY